MTIFVSVLRAVRIAIVLSPTVSGLIIHRRHDRTGSCRDEDYAASRAPRRSGEELVGQPEVEQGKAFTCRSREMIEQRNLWLNRFVYYQKGVILRHMKTCRYPKSSDARQWLKI